MTISIEGSRVLEATSGFDPNSLTWTITLSEEKDQPVTIFYRMYSATAVLDIDARGDTTPGSFITIAAGETVGEISLTIDGDSNLELDEAVVLEVYEVVGDTLPANTPIQHVTSWILDDDGTAEPGAAHVASPVIIEGDDGSRKAVFTVSLSRAPGESTTFAYQTVDGSAEAGSDYVAASGNLVFSAAQVEGTIEVDLIGDAIPEGMEDFWLRLTTNADYDITVEPAFIIDDDADVPTISVTGERQPELTTGFDSGYIQWTLILSEPSDQPISVEWRVKPGTAVPNSDAYGTDAGVVVFEAGATTAYVQYRVDADALAENNETVVLELYDPKGAGFAGDTPILRSTSWIIDDDGSGNDRAIFVSNPVVVEGDDGQKFAVFEVSMAPAIDGDFIVNYATTDGTAKAGSDYVADSGTVTFSENVTTANVKIAIIGDDVVENIETFGLNITTESGLIEVISDGEATIIDDDSGEPAVSILSMRETELTTGFDSGYMEWTLVLDRPSDQPIDVSYRFISGTADFEFDAYNAGQTVTFEAGETEATVLLRIDGDAVSEDDETIVLEVYEANGGVLAGDAIALRSTGWIIDDDGTGNKRALFVSNPVLTEGDSGEKLAVFELSLSRPATSDFTVDFETIDGSAVAGDDYVATAGSITFEAGQRTASVEVAVSGDTTSEGTEYFSLNVISPAVVEVTTDGVATIFDDDSGNPTLNLTGSVVKEFTSGFDPGDLFWTLTLDKPSDQPVEVFYRFESDTGDVTTDGSGTDGSVTIEAGETSARVFFRIDGDQTSEFDESIVLEVYDIEGAELAGGAKLLREASVILDDDGSGNKRVLHVSDPKVEEGNDGDGQRVVFDLTLSRPSEAEITVDYTTADGTAAFGSDYFAKSGTVTFAPGQTKASVSVLLIGDEVIEANETFALIVTPSGGVATFTNGSATILNDDKNRAPEAIDDVFATDLDTTFVSGDLGVRANDFDPDNDPLLVQLLNDVTNGTLSLSTSGAFEYTPDDGFVGIDTFSYSVTDGEFSDTALVEINVTQLTFKGTSGDNLITANTFDNTIIGFAGNDTLNGRGGDDEIRGGSGNDRIDAGAGNDTAEGGDGNDSMLGLSGDDIFVGEAGNDTMRGGNGDDQLIGGAGRDDIWGGNDDDDVRGGGGVDNVRGSDGNDLVAGGKGADTVGGGRGRDTISGDEGDDLIFGGGGDDQISAGAGADQVIAGGGRDTVFGGSMDDTLGGGDGNDRLVGGGGSDSLKGGTGDDELEGRAGNDTLEGAAGADTLMGGDGNDLLTGGGEADIFVFEDGFGTDVVTDFSADDDEEIDLSAVKFIDNFGDLLNNHLVDDNGTAKIVIFNDSILLEGVAFDDVGWGLDYSAKDFSF